MVKFCCAIVLIFLFSFTAALAAEEKVPEKPEGTVWNFYEFHFTHDMGFTKETLELRKQWLSAGLMDAAQKYFAQPENPDEAPEINGDPFTNTQEYPDRYDVGKPEISKENATIPVTFYWKEVNDPRSVIVVLTQTNGHWLISDIEYPETKDSLMKLLR